ncbi:hypothetical protein N0V93_004459 [Gnomoniopsis smithogilvyi]|uniref:F-box domain-containing protein n=1 Tax=Gnomoniopsis smithogilvyi TaxID=1191159 RepID=A0A9W9CX41_9PEZI|nr:hypothetical protein N0V93_004459 [Gnomoniopsis smithogilvyi]
MATEPDSAPFNRLPVEVLLNIALRVPDLPSLYAFDRASNKFALVFNEYGSYILERVLDTARLGAPPHQVREIIRLVIYVRTACLKENTPKTPSNLEGFVSQLFEQAPGSAAYTPIHPNTPTFLLREILAIAATIDQLASLCLATFMRRCLALRPSHPIDRTGPKPSGFMGPQPEYFARPGYTYIPHSSGPPTWLETQRVLRAFWTVQLYLDLCWGVTVGRLTFTEDSDEGLRELKFSEMEISRGRPLLSGERAVKAVVKWLCEELGWRLPVCKAEDLEQDEKNMRVHLPYIPKQETEQAFDWDNEGKGWFPGCEDEFVFQHDKLHEQSLSEAPGEFFLETKIGSLRRFSPVFNISESPIFQDMGIAFWDSRRLMGLELLGPHEEDGFAPCRGNTTKYYSMWELMYTWISIANAQETSS